MVFVYIYIKGGEYVQIDCIPNKHMYRESVKWVASHLVCQ